MLVPGTRSLPGNGIRPGIAYTPWLAPVLIIGAIALVVCVAAAVALDPNGGRIAVLIGLAVPLAVLALGDAPAAAAAVFFFLPFMGGIRRVIYLFSDYVSFDPILLIAPVITFVLMAHVLVFRRLQLQRLARRSRATRLVFLVLAIFGLQLLNPLQGSPAVAFGGVLYYIVPVLWFVIGALGIGPRLSRMVPVMVATASLCAVYGLYQVYVGYPWFDRYWIEHGGYTALQMGAALRPFSSFPNAVEYAGYIGASAAVAAVYAVRARQPLALLPLPLLLWATVMTGTRGAVVMALLGIGVALFSAGRSRAARVLTVTAVLAAVPLLAAGLRVLPSLGGEHREARDLLTHQSQGLLNPGESTAARLLLPGIWHTLQYVATSRPLGSGLGSTTLANRKFGVAGETAAEIDLGLIGVATGVPGLLAYEATVLYLLLRAGLLSRHPQAAGAEAAGLAWLVTNTGNWLYGSYWVIPTLTWLIAGAVEARALSLEDVKHS